MKTKNDINLIVNKLRDEINCVSELNDNNLAIKSQYLNLKMALTIATDLADHAHHSNLDEYYAICNGVLEVLAATHVDSTLLSSETVKQNVASKITDFLKIKGMQYDLTVWDYKSEFLQRASWATAKTKLRVAAPKKPHNKAADKFKMKKRVSWGLVAVVMLLLIIGSVLIGPLAAPLIFTAIVFCMFAGGHSMYNECKEITPLPDELNAVDASQNGQTSTNEINHGLAAGNNKASVASNDHVLGEPKTLERSQSLEDFSIFKQADVAGAELTRSPACS